MAIQVDVVCVDERDPNSPRREVYGKEQILIGRAGDNDLVLEHPSMSANHLRLRVEKNGGAPTFFVTDLKSTNGTFVGNRQAPPQIEMQLSERERLMVAGYVLRLQYVVDSRADAEGAAANEEKSSKQRLTAPISKTGVFARTEGPSLADLASAEDDAPAAAPAASPDDEAWEATAVEPPVAPPKRDKRASTFAEPAVLNGAAASVLIRDSDIDIDFVATQLFSVRGRILHNSAPVLGASVSDPELGFRITDSSGEFRFDNIPDGSSYRLTLAKDGLSFTEAEFAGTIDGADVEIATSALRFAKIRGRVMHRGLPLAGVVVDGGALGTVTTDSAGAYEFANVLEGGEYTLTAFKDGFIFGTMKKSAQ